MSRLGLAAGIVMAAGMASGEDQLPFVGVWTADQSWCAYADRIGSHMPAPVAITRTEVLGYENSCWIIEAEPLNDTWTAWSLKSECQSEGSTYDAEEIILIASDNEIWRFQGGRPFRMTRCEGVK